MMSRLAENDRWNRFVEKVRWTVGPLVGLSICELLLAMYMFKLMPRLTYAEVRWTALRVLVGGSILILLLYRGYSRIYF